MILMVDYCTPTGRDLNSVEGQRVITDLVTKLVDDLADVGWVDRIDAGNPRGAPVYLVGPDRHRLWYAVETTLKGWPLRSITALLRAADRHRPDTFHVIGFEPEVDRDVPEELMLEVLASMSRALWEVPTPPLRAVTLNVTRAEVRGRFMYAEPPNEDEAELVSLCETYPVADSAGIRPQFGVEFSPVYVPVDQDRTLNVGEQWFYLRHEPDEAGASEH